MKDVDYTFETCDIFCDQCDREIRIDSIDYSVINDELKSEGWLIRRINGVWHEFCCKECYEKFLTW